MSTTAKLERKRSALSSLQLTPGRGLGQRAEGEVIRKTPLKREARVQTGVCGKTVSLRTPKKPETPRRKRLRVSTVQEVRLEVPAVEGLIPQTSLVIKSNPLYNGALVEQKTKHSKIEAATGTTPCDGARNPLFYGQRRNIRKTKEQEMITAIMELAQYGEKTMRKKSKVKSIVKKAKAVLGRHKSHSDISKPKSPVRKGAFFLRPRQRTK